MGGNEVSQATAESAVKAFLKAWNSHNLDAVLAALDENVVAVISASPEPIRGKQGLRTQWGMLYKLCPDVHHEVQSMISQGNTVAYESIETAVFAPDSINEPYRT